MNPNTMTVEQCRDWLAVDIQHQTLASLGSKARSEDYYAEPDPIGATLDAAAAAMPEGWRFLRMEESETGAWNAWAGDKFGRHAKSFADTELHCRFRLAVACRMAMKEKA